MFMNLIWSWKMGNITCMFQVDTHSYIIQKPFSIIRVLWPWPLTPKSIGIIIDSWEIYLASFMTKGEIQAVICPETIINHQSPITLTFDLDPKINRGHPSFIGSISGKFHDYMCNTGSNMVWKPFSIYRLLWPWPLTFWPQNQKGSSLIHGKHFWEVSWL